MFHKSVFNDNAPFTKTLLLVSINIPSLPPPAYNIKRLRDLKTTSFTAEEVEKEPAAVAIAKLLPLAEPNLISGNEISVPNYHYQL